MLSSLCFQSTTKLWDASLWDTRFNLLVPKTHRMSHSSESINLHKHFHSSSLANKNLVPQPEVLPVFTLSVRFVSLWGWNTCDAAEEISIFWLGVIKITGENLRLGDVKWGTVGTEGPRLKMG